MALPDVAAPPADEGLASVEADGKLAEEDTATKPDDAAAGPEMSEVETLRAQLAEAREQNAELLLRCKKLARVVSKADASTQTVDDMDADGVGGADAGARLPPEVDMMLRNPKDAVVQLNGIETLFAQQTQVDTGGGPSNSVSTPAVMLSASLEAVYAIFVNHPGNHTLILKASQFTSLLLAESNAHEQLPTVLLLQIVKEVVSVGSRLLAPSPGSATPADASGVTPNKLMTWIISLVSALLPCLTFSLKDQAISETFVHDLLAKLVHPLLASAELPQESLTLKCVQLLPLLPPEAWIQKLAVETGAVHSLALMYHRSSGSAVVRRDRVNSVTSTDGSTDVAMPKAVRIAVNHVFADNLELCVRALHDMFVSDEFVCQEVLEQLRSMGKRRGSSIIMALDADHSILSKLLGLWAFHQRSALEDSSPENSASLEVLKKVAELMGAVLTKIPPKMLLRRMQEYQNAEVLQRMALSAIHSSVHLRLQVAVNYVDNGIAPVIISCLQMFLRHYEKTPEKPSGADVAATFALLRDETLPADGWSYIRHCLHICNHVLSHWSATKISLRVDALDSRSAPLLLAQSGLVDALAQLVDPVAAGFDMAEMPPQAVAHQATETLQALFEQSGHICLFCMQHYAEVRQMVALGCDSLATDPLADFPDLQEKAVDQLSVSFDRFAVQDERIGRKVLKALSALFESSCRLVAWYLKNNPLSSQSELQSTDIHVEAVRSVSRAPYWSSEDAALLPEFVGLVAQLMLGSIEGHGLDPNTSKPIPAQAGQRVLDLTEAEEVVASCITTLLHLMLIDPSPPTVLECLAVSLARAVPDNDGASTSETAVNAIMRIMQVFPSSDRLQLNCQHLLTSLLGE